MYEYRAKITDVYDGDTVTAFVDLGFKHFFEIKLRLFEIDTPELRGAEKEEGKKVRDLVREKILDKEVVLKTHKDGKGKYGRYLAEVILQDGTNLNDWLVVNGYAKEFMK